MVCCGAVGPQGGPVALEIQGRQQVGIGIGGCGSALDIIRCLEPLSPS